MEKINKITKDLVEPNNVYKRFNTWALNVAVTITHGNIAQAAMVWIETETKTKASSQRTYFSQILSGFSLASNVPVPTTPLTRKIQRMLVERMEGEDFNKAPILEPEHIFNASSAASIRGILRMLFLTCARVGNADGFYTMNLSPPEKTSWTTELVHPWKIKWTKHKTYRFLGTQIIVIPVPDSMMNNELRMAIEESRTYVSWENIEVLISALEKSRIRLHSIRRSGAKYWERKGMDLTSIQRITMHTSLASLVQYLQD